MTDMKRTWNAKQQELHLLDQPSIQETDRADHRDDFEQTAVPYMTALYDQAYYLTMNSDDAKDLLQETYLKAYRFWDKFEKGTNIRGWLYQIMKNSYINHYRKRTKEPRSIEFDETISYNMTVKNFPLETRHDTLNAPHDVFGDEIARSLESLPSDFRTVVMLSDMEDFTYEEIANVIAVPLGTVRSRLHRGRRLLKKRLQNYATRNRCLL
jgi:RNA polymerase sigma-70 factor, ECF subfamily